MPTLIFIIFIDPGSFDGNLTLHIISGGCILGFLKLPRMMAGVVAVVVINLFRFDPVLLDSRHLYIHSPHPHMLCFRALPTFPGHNFTSHLPNWIPNEFHTRIYRANHPPPLSFATNELPSDTTPDMLTLELHHHHYSRHLRVALIKPCLRLCLSTVHPFTAFLPSFLVFHLAG